MPNPSTSSPWDVAHGHTCPKLVGWFYLGVFLEYRIYSPIDRAVSSGFFLFRAFNRKYLIQQDFDDRAVRSEFAPEREGRE
jgi:hypothetical protein